MAKDSQPRTAFTTPFGLYQFKVMPFGLQGAPACFQRMMDRLISGLDESAAAYIDDLIIFSSSWSDHLSHVRQVLERLKAAAGLTVKPKKCHFGKRECTYLGHCIGNGLVKPAQSKLDALEAVTTPTTKRQVRAFLGLAGYYRRFIPDFSSIATPLTDLLRKNCPKVVQSTTECETAFRTLKRLLCSSPVLRAPNNDRPFILQTDTSDHGIGAVLVKWMILG